MTSKSEVYVFNGSWEYTELEDEFDLDRDLLGLTELLNRASPPRFQYAALPSKTSDRIELYEYVGEMDYEQLITGREEND